MAKKIKINQETNIKYYVIYLLELNSFTYYYILADYIAICGS